MGANALEAPNLVRPRPSTEEGGGRLQLHTAWQAAGGHVDRGIKSEHMGSNLTKFGSLYQSIDLGELYLTAVFVFNFTPQEQKLLSRTSSISSRPCALYARRE